MKADRIIKNAKIYTSDKDNPQATELAAKDGRFVYVGDEAGLASFEDDGKQEALAPMAKYIQENPGQERYRFFLEQKCLKSEDLTMGELDAVELAKAAR